MSGKRIVVHPDIVDLSERLGGAGCTECMNNDTGEVYRVYDIEAIRRAEREFKEQCRQVKQDPIYQFFWGLAALEVMYIQAKNKVKSFFKKGEKEKWLMSYVKIIYFS